MISLFTTIKAFSKFRKKIIEIVADVNFQLKKMGSKIRIVWTLPTNQGADMHITYACLWFFEQPEDRIPPVAKMFLMTLPLSLAGCHLTAVG